MAVKVAINGFGRIGRLVLRALVESGRTDLEVVGINDLGPVNTLTSTLAKVGFAQLGSDLSLIQGKKIAFTSLGGTMDWNNVVAQAEVAMRVAKEPVYVPDTTSWYLMAGYRIGKVLPYVAHAAVHDAGHSVTLPAGFPKTGALGTPVASLMAAAEQKNDLVGVRWDFAKSMALTSPFPK